jgi:hypothetical protein
MTPQRPAVNGAAPGPLKANCHIGPAVPATTQASPLVRFVSWGPPTTAKGGERIQEHA